MTTEDYLKITGYSKEEWTVLDEETSKLYREKQGAVNNMYPINDKKFIKELGAGYNLVNLAWREKYKLDVETKEVAFADASPQMIEAKNMVQEVFPAAAPPPPPTKKEEEPPIISGMVPPPPPKFVVNSIEEEDEIDMIELIKAEPPLPVPQDDFFCEQEAQIGSPCDEQCESCKKTEHGPSEECEVEIIRDIVKQSGIPENKVIIASIPKPQTVLEAKTEWRISQVTDLGLTLKGSNYTDATNTYGISVDSVNNYTNEAFHNAILDMKKHIESLNAVVEEVPEVVVPVVEAPIQNDPILDADEKLNIFKNKNRANRLIEIGLAEEEFQFGNGTQAISKEWIRTLPDDKFEKEFEILVKGIALDKELEEMKLAKEAEAKIPTPKEEVKPEVKETVEQEVIVGDEKTIQEFEFLDNLIATANTFKKTAYAIKLIQNALKCADLTPAKKIVLIEKAVQNIK